MEQNEQAFGQLKHIIESRRTLKPEAMNGKTIPDATMDQILALADWAPTHGRTEPWRFFVYKGESLKKICQVHADMYKEHSPVETFNPGTYDNLMHKGDLASHLVIAVMKRGTNPKIPAIEELVSASISVQNALLGATALGIATMWSTGGMTHKHPLKQYLQLAEEDSVLGLIYFGYTDEPDKEGKRGVPLSEKILAQ